MQRPLKDASFGTDIQRLRNLDLDGLSHPAQAFEHPSQVVADPISL